MNSERTVGSAKCPSFPRHVEAQCPCAIGGAEGHPEMNKNMLLWNEAGRLACSEHAPFRGSDTWCAERWRPVRVCERVDFEAEIGRAPACETCEAIKRRSTETAS